MRAFPCARFEDASPSPLSPDSELERPYTYQKHIFRARMQDLVKPLRIQTARERTVPTTSDTASQISEAPLLPDRQRSRILGFSTFRWALIIFRSPPSLRGHRHETR